MISPDILAIAWVFIRRHGRLAADSLRRIASEHEQERSEDAAFWAAVAEMAEAIRPNSGDA